MKKCAPKLLSESVTAGEAAFLILHADFDKFRASTRLVRESEDSEAVHVMRVSIRRIRAALKTFKAFLPPAMLELDPELKWVFRKLGALRDLDVQLAMVAGYAEHQHPEQSDLVAVSNKLFREQKQAKASVLKSIESEKFRSLDERLAQLISNGPTAKKGLTGVPLLAAAPDLVRRSYRKAAKAAKGLHAGSSSPDFHKLRRQAKKLRYNLEFFRELYIKPAEDLIVHLKAVQDVLGSRQDDVAATDHLEALAAKNGLTAQAKQLAHEMGCAFQNEARSFEKDFDGLRKKVFGQPWKALHREMERTRRELWRT